MKTCANAILDGALFGRASYCSCCLLYFTGNHLFSDGDAGTESEKHEHFFTGTFLRILVNHYESLSERILRMSSSMRLLLYVYNIGRVLLFEVICRRCESRSVAGHFMD